ncbi:MAG: response regulator [Rhodospirillales bacterium]|nr:response regulator [Rhodospirillales bacterium]MBO6785767.1 response regulator [Rhodospirillales bacterium]
MTLKLLIVDDNPADRAIVRRMLGSTDLDADLHEVALLAELLKMPLEEFDCALIDVRLPDGDGIDTLGDICKGASYPPCPVIVMSGLGDEHTAARAFKAGANDYLIKDSLTPNTLRRTLVNAIDKWHAEDAMRNDWESQQDALRNAERANRAKTQFISTLSHQLRVPLTAIMGFAEMIEIAELGDDETAWKKYRDYAGDIRRSARDVLELAASVIELTRTEADGDTVFATNFDPRKTLRDVVDAFSEEAGEAQIGLEIDDQKAPHSIFTDDRAVQAIMTNLLSNAIKYTPAGHHVLVRLCDVDDENCMFSVADEGAGQNRKDAHGVVHPLDPPASDFASGDDYPLGVGLPLVTSLVRVLGGELSVDKGPGVGTIASVVLPKQAPSHDTQPDS